MSEIRPLILDAAKSFGETPFAWPDIHSRMSWIPARSIRDQLNELARLGRLERVGVKPIYRNGHQPSAFVARVDDRIAADVAAFDARWRERAGAARFDEPLTMTEADQLRRLAWWTQ